MSEKWFEPIKSGEKNIRNLPKEPKQKAKRTKTVESEVPFDAIYLAYHCCARTDKEYFATDLLSDTLSLGSSSRLYQKLVKEKQMFLELNAYITADIDKGLFVVTGKLKEDVNFEQAEVAIKVELDEIASNLINENEFEKVKNKMESRLVYSDTSVLNKAMNLAYAELLGGAELVNKEKMEYAAVTREEIRDVAKNVFEENNCSVLYYKAKKS